MSTVEREIIRVSHVTYLVSIPQFMNGFCWCYCVVWLQKRYWRNVPFLFLEGDTRLVMIDWFNVYELYQTLRKNMGKHGGLPQIDLVVVFEFPWYWLLRKSTWQINVSVADLTTSTTLTMDTTKMNGRQQRNKHEISPNGNGNGCQDETNSSQSTVLTEYRHHEQVYQQASLFHPNSS